MGSPAVAAELGGALLRAIREATPEPVAAPRWRRIEAEAVARGFSSTRALREWCMRRGVTLREENHRDTWVNPSEIDAAVERLPAAVPTARQLGPRAVDAETEADVDATLGVTR